MMSPLRKAPAMRRAISRRMESPARWPRLSLTFLKLSTSIMKRTPKAEGRASRRAMRISSSAVALLKRPVMGSLRLLSSSRSRSRFWASMSRSAPTLLIGRPSASRRVARSSANQRRWPEAVGSRHSARPAAAASSSPARKASHRPSLTGSTASAPRSRSRKRGTEGSSPKTSRYLGA